ncbi:glycosyltransferase family 2 protein [Paenarthrobacter sp. Z7-10]|uniref:glycosyltransferase family 2 protein n=1 Tax=Paenarthrobacter sp. Z7-10 TaxID=2787635 RepID=UPI0022A8E34A|nr:glycosyltransferase family A protein [Paenarthrobacter sp. Z7-10]MCZ2403922.1 glycosyltransferase family 2 protein [Paenarthrobacter sp. Z7-10]
MSANARVAVVVRTKNRSVLLARALADIFDQTFADLTVVVVNDGGDPAPVDAIAGAYAHLPAGRLMVIHHLHSAGMEAASNAGIRASQSDYIVIHDDDDRWHPDFLLNTVQHLDAHPGVRGVTVRTEIVFEDIIAGEILQTGTQPWCSELTSITLADMMTSNRMVPISFLYRRAVHEEVGYYNEDLDAVGDWEFSLRFLSYNSIDLLSEEPLAYWCQRPSLDGDLGNSVIAAADDHQKFDRYVRDHHLRHEIRQGGLGSLLYLAEMAGAQEAEAAHARRTAELLIDKVDRLAQRMEALEESVQRRTSLTDLAKRPGRFLALIRDVLQGRR